jgi:type II secretory ATPase GspE/PulE/Tfp pilus assembly ATPase PilB-like protein
MIDMGIEAFNVASAVNLVVAQRLVRRICKSCAAPVSYREEEIRSLSPDQARVAALNFIS